MKRTIFLRFLCSALSILYSILILLSIFTNFVPIYKYWFSLALCILSVMLLARYFCYYVSSSLYAGFNLLFCGVFGILNYYLNFNIPFTIAGYLTSFAISSIFMFVIFRHFFHFKTFVFFTLCVIVLLVYSANVISLYTFVWLMAGIALGLIFFLIKSVRTNLRKV